MFPIEKLKDKRFDPERMKDVGVLVHKFSQGIREVRRDALENGIENPMVFLVELADAFGDKLVKLWQSEDGLELPKGKADVLLLPLALARAEHIFGRLKSRALLDITVPKPTVGHLDVIVVASGMVSVIAIALDESTPLSVEPGERKTIDEEGIRKSSQELMMPTLITTLSNTTEGVLIKAIAIPWMEILWEINRDPDFLYKFANNPRKFEEFIAASYSQAGYDNVTLTPASGDFGRDVIATIEGVGAVRFLDQCKAFSKGHIVTANEVRAIAGVLLRDQNASKAIITTTSDFAPGVALEFGNLMPYRLETRNGRQLISWLISIQPRR